MVSIVTLEDIATLRESSEVECKLAQGRDGKGQLPDDIWESYSAFANTDGGDILLGLKELEDESYQLAGIENTEKVIDELWQGLNNKTVTNMNLIPKNWIKVVTIMGKNMIHILVPKAPPEQKPIYIKTDPLKGTYVRLGSADMQQDAITVSRLLAEQRKILEAQS
ncbi:AlbA family DNA-binding domain-containing protein [Marinomonas sp. PE14-40]|uniref:AlbA family DNA-binding domain-containing protein n=1 Tax=Marinomonas sp. PE14-40 TaxID=3060621 RepID=UPI003F67D5DF